MHSVCEIARTHRKPRRKGSAAPGANGVLDRSDCLPDMAIGDCFPQESSPMRMNHRWQLAACCNAATLAARKPRAAKKSTPIRWDQESVPPRNATHSLRAGRKRTCHRSARASAVFRAGQRLGLMLHLPRYCSADSANLRREAVSNRRASRRGRRRRTCGGEGRCFVRQKSPRGQFEHKRVFQAGEVGLSCEHRCDLTAQPARRVPVVIVPVRDDGAARLRAGAISLFANRCARRQPHVARPGSLFDKVAHRIVAIVDDDQFSRGIVLRIERFERKRQETPPIERRHDARNQRQLRSKRRLRTDAVAKARHS